MHLMEISHNFENSHDRFPTRLGVDITIPNLNVFVQYIGLI